jgi:adenine C2-methylase RlmN of 23S rRNA A2503 and tRNA A37
MKKIKSQYFKKEYFMLIVIIIVHLTANIHSVNLKIKNKIKLKNIATPPILEDDIDNYKTSKNYFNIIDNYYMLRYIALLIFYR